MKFIKLKTENVIIDLDIERIICIKPEFECNGYSPLSYTGFYQVIFEHGVMVKIYRNEYEYLIDILNKMSNKLQEEDG